MGHHDQRLVRWNSSGGSNERGARPPCSTAPAAGAAAEGGRGRELCDDAGDATEVPQDLKTVGEGLRRREKVGEGEMRPKAAFGVNKDCVSTQCIQYMYLNVSSMYLNVWGQGQG